MKILLELGASDILLFIAEDGIVANDLIISDFIDEIKFEKMTSYEIFDLFLRSIKQSIPSELNHSNIRLHGSELRKIHEGISENIREYNYNNIYEIVKFIYSLTGNFNGIGRSFLDGEGRIIIDRLLADKEILSSLKVELNDSKFDSYLNARISDQLKLLTGLGVEKSPYLTFTPNRRGWIDGDSLLEPVRLLKYLINDYNGNLSEELRTKYILSIKHFIIRFIYNRNLYDLRTIKANIHHWCERNTEYFYNNIEFVNDQVLTLKDEINSDIIDDKYYDSFNKFITKFQKYYLTSQL